MHKSKGVGTTAPVGYSWQALWICNRKVPSVIRGMVLSIFFQLCPFFKIILNNLSLKLIHTILNRLAQNLIHKTYCSL